MALSDNEREKLKPRKQNRAIDAKSNFRWSDKQKMEAVTSYLALGNLALVGRLLGIPEITLRVWKASEWWKTVADEVKTQERIELSNRMKSLVDASQRIVAQRLENGDPVLNQKTGEIIMKPVSMKDAHKVAVDLLDRRNVIEKMAETGTVTEEGADNKLEKLAERFAAMATKSIEKQMDKKRTIDVDATSVQDVEEVIPHEPMKGNHDALHEEREARLQEGVREVPQSPGTDQEPDGTDHGSSAS